MLRLLDNTFFNSSENLTSLKNRYMFDLEVEITLLFLMHSNMDLLVFRYICTTLLLFN